VVTRKAEGPVVVEVALAAALHDGYNVVGIPDALVLPV
jgi:hypothetical protein